MLEILKVFLSALFEVVGPLLMKQLDRPDIAEHVRVEDTNAVRERLLREARNFEGI